MFSVLFPSINSYPSCTCRNTNFKILCKVIGSSNFIGSLPNSTHCIASIGLLVPEQYAFRKGMSTEDTAFMLTDSILKSLNQNLYVGGIFCDLLKAFDCVNHEILSKLHFMAFKE